MNFFALPLLITDVILAVMGFFVLFKNIRSQLNVTFFLFCLSMVVWLSGFSAMYLTKDPLVALQYARIGFLGVVFIPVFAYHFVITILNLKNNFFLYIIYILSALAIIASRTPYVYSSITRHFWGYYPVAGKFYFVFLVMFISVFMYII